MQQCESIEMGLDAREMREKYALTPGMGERGVGKAAIWRKENKLK